MQKKFTISNKEVFKRNKIEEGFLTAIPGETDPKKLYYPYQKKLLNSLSAYLTNLATTIKIDLRPYVEYLEGLNSSKQFSAALFSAYVHLKEAYDKKDIQSALDAVQLLKMLSLDQIYSEKRSYGTILTE